MITLYYFTYDFAGRSNWLVGNIDYQPDQKRVRIPLVTGSGARFGSAFDRADVVITLAGHAWLESIGCGRLRLRYQGEVTFGLDLQRLAGELIDSPCLLPEPEPGATDLALHALIAEHGLSGDPALGRDLPGIGAPLARLGKLLFFSKSLGAELDTACASCHHPALGGADGLALSIGAGALDPEVMGPGRRLPDGGILMHRNTNTFFNTALFDRGLFWDSRIERISDDEGNDGGIGTPESDLGVADPQAGPNLLTAQARFPVLEPAEMRGAGLPGMDSAQVRHHLAERIGDYGDGQGLLPESAWLDRFRAAFDSGAGAEELITFDNITLALAEYQRSAIFVETPWSQYVRGDYSAIDSQAKDGALLFFRTIEEGGMHCVRCHSGDFFTDQQHHRVGFPQVGPGFGDGPDGSEDFGRKRETGQEPDRHAFRTPSLLNVELTAPYGHTGAYRDRRTVVAHYVNTIGTVVGQLSLRTWCLSPPFDTKPGCGVDFELVRANSMAALDSMEAARVEDPDSAMPVVPVALSTAANFDRVTAFLRTLTDPCLHDRDCLAPWIPEPDEAPDEFQLNAIDTDGNPI